MNAVKALFLFVSVIGHIQAFSNILPNESNHLNKNDAIYDISYNPIYKVVLFNYFNNDYQEALKELALITTSDLTPTELKNHNAFKQILMLSNGQTSIESLISVSQNQAAIESLLLAINTQIDSKNWQQANKLFKLLPKEIPQQLQSQHLFLLGQLTLESNSQVNYQKAKGSLNPNSLEYAVLLQHQSVKGNEPSISLLNQLISLNNESLNNESFSHIKNSGLLALGYRFLDINDGQSAAVAFKNISVNSLSDNAGSLGLGLAFNQLNQFSNARILLNRVSKSGDPSVVYYESQLADAYALEQLGDEQQSLDKLIITIAQATQRINDLPVVEKHIINQSQCIINLLNNVLLNQCDLKGEELNEQFLSLLSTQPFVDINKQINSITKLELQYNQQLETLMSFDYLLNHQVKLITDLLNNSAMLKLKNEIKDITAKTHTVVTNVDHAENTENAHFFLSEHYLSLQERIDKIFKSMVFLKRSGQKNIASERRVTLMQSILWWQSYSNFSQNIENTRTSIDQLNKQLTDNNHAYDILKQYLVKVPLMLQQLQTVLEINQNITQEKTKLIAVKNLINNDAINLFNTFFIEQKAALEKVLVNAYLAKLRIEDASFNRVLTTQEGGE